MDGAQVLQNALWVVAIWLGFHRPHDPLCSLELGNLMHTGPQPVSLEEQKKTKGRENWASLSNIKQCTWSRFSIRGWSW